MKCVALFVAPGFVAIFVHDEYNYFEWRWAFISLGVLCIIANALFYPIATDQPQAFTLITRESRMKEKQLKNATKIADIEKSGTIKKSSNEEEFTKI